MTAAPTSAGDDPAKAGITASLRSIAWDSWIWISADSTAAFFEPHEERDAAIASRLGLCLAPTSDGLNLIHRGEDLEAT